jgi:hypothetical protein
MIAIEGIGEHYSIYKKINLERYISEKNLMPNEEIHQMLVEGGFMS